MLLSELKKKEVINLKDCNILGHVTDLEFDPCSGCIQKLIITDKGAICSLFQCNQDYVICFKQIKQIGPDIIIVELC